MSSADDILKLLDLKCELAKEQRYHDAEINRICSALGFTVPVPMEDILKEIKRLRNNQKQEEAA